LWYSSVLSLVAEGKRVEVLVVLVALRFSREIFSSLLYFIASHTPTATTSPMKRKGRKSIEANITRAITVANGFFFINCTVVIAILAVTRL
jgi:hypothetical protein